MKIVLVGFILFISFANFAQINEGKEKKANTAYENFAYDKAIEGYKELEVTSIDLMRKEAMSYWRLQNTIAAEPLFKDIALSEGHTPEDVLNYALVLRANGKYEESEEWITKYAALNETDFRGSLYAREKGSYQRLLKENKEFTIQNLDINSEEQDFAAIFYKDQIVFASSREGVKPIRRKWNWNRLPFLDVYVADKKEDNSLVNPVRMNGKINKKFHEGPVTFNAAGDFMIFTRNNYSGTSSAGVVCLQLFSSQLIDGKWSKPTPLPFNDNEYSVGHAALSVDGKWLYFASNMPGGLGGVDLYRAAILENGSYGEAINLGKKINTEGDEMFPFVHAGGEMLFFSSNGRVGLGGQDVFLAQLKPNNEIGKVMNLGAPINSNADDFSFVITENQTVGYFSSNREGGKGSDDIYSFNLSKPFVFGKVIKGVAKDNKGNVLADTKVTLFDLITGEEERVTTGLDGSFEFSVEEDKTFNLRGQKDTYFQGTNAADTHTSAESVYVDLVLVKDPGISLYGIVKDKKSGVPLAGVKLILIDYITGVKETLYTDKSGEFLKPLTDKELDTKASYKLVLEKAGYLGKTLTYNTLFDHEGKYTINAVLDLTLDQIQVGGDLSKIIDINPIYFDLNKAIIRPDAALELDKIVKVMNENPNMVIELGSHTDSRGSDVSNESLSDRRAKASAAYIAERITNPDRIAGKGYGESKPTTVNASEDGGAINQLLTEEFINTFKSTDKNLFDKYHQMNRRTEFIIIKM